jgi:hypothetical protein
MRKEGEILQKTVIHIILIALILSLFLFAILGKSSSNDVKRQLLEKQTALLIESSPKDTTLELNVHNLNGEINNIRIEGYEIFIDVNGFKSTRGYPFFSKYLVSVSKDESQNKFMVHIE